MNLPHSAPLTGAILALTLLLVVWRPRGLPEPAAAVIGASLALLTGVSLPADLRAGAQDTAGILVFLVAVMVLASLAALCWRCSLPACWASHSGRRRWWAPARWG